MNGTTTAERVAVFLRDDFNPPPDSLMNIQEWDAYSLLSAAFNAFLQLPSIFPGDQAEVGMHINAAKNVILSRPVMREMAAAYAASINNVAAAGQTPKDGAAFSPSPEERGRSFAEIHGVPPPPPGDVPDAEIDQIVGIRPLGGYDSVEGWHGDA